MDETRAAPATQPAASGRNWRESVRLFLTGFAMGCADIVPGVSGGTIAFILGVYERLVGSIRVVTGTTLREMLHLRIAAAIRSAPLPFLVPLGLGILVAAFSLANVISWALREHPVYVWSFFFGLVGASIVVVTGRVRVWSPVGVGAFAVAALAAYLLVGLAPTTTPDTTIAMFLAGSIAICAMILPGISGSFILIVIGKYDQVLDAVVNRDVLALGVFMLGAAVGIALFSRLLGWLLARQHDLMVLTLAGLMLGSLRKVWPWKETLTTRINSHGEEVPLQEANILPAAFDETVVLALALAIGGAVLILLLDKLGSLNAESR